LTGGIWEAVQLDGALLWVLQFIPDTYFVCDLGPVSGASQTSIL
jgi:hypothetical protein